MARDNAFNFINVTLYGQDPRHKVRHREILKDERPKQLLEGGFSFLPIRRLGFSSAAILGYHVMVIGERGAGSGVVSVNLAVMR